MTEFLLISFNYYILIQYFVFEFLIIHKIIFTLLEKPRLLSLKYYSSITQMYIIIESNLYQIN